MTLSADTVFRDFVTDKVPSSGPHKVKKAEVRKLFAGIDASLAGFQAGGGIIFQTKAAMTLTYSANQMAWVIADPTSAENGIYQKQGASGSGSWTRVGDLPYSFVRLTDAGTGTADAIQVTSAIPTSTAVMRVANVFRTSAGNVTISENGATARPLMTASGNQIVPRGLLEGMMIAYLDDGTNFRLMSDQASAAILPAMEGLLASSQAAAAAALAAAAGVNLPPVAANTMLVDNAAGTARESKTFDEVRDLLNVSRVGEATTVPEVAAFDPARFSNIYVTSDQGLDNFIKRSWSDFSAMAAVDPLGGVIQRSSVDSTKCFVRSGFLKGLPIRGEWFGFNPINDSVIDNAPALKASVAFAAEAWYRSGQIVELPAGVAYLGSIIPLPNRVAVRGPNSRSLYFAITDSFAQDTLFYANNGTNSMFGSRLEDMWIDARVNTNFTGSIAGTTLTVNGMGSAVGPVRVGQTISGANVAVGTKITGRLTGRGGVGTYAISINHTVVANTPMLATKTSPLANAVIQSDAWQETSGMNRVGLQFDSNTPTGIRLEHGYGGAAFTTISECEIFSDSTAAISYGIRVPQISPVGGFVLKVANCTVSGTAARPMTYGIQMVNDSLKVDTFHGEYISSEMIQMAGAGGLSADTITGSSNNVNDVIGFGAGFTGPWSLRNILPNGASRFSLYNRPAGTTKSGNIGSLSS